METAVVVALISSLSSLAVALWTRWGQRDLEYVRHRLKLEEKNEERRFSAGEELRRYVRGDEHEPDWLRKSSAASPGA
jgi:hypothetical protein